ncbi:MAG: hypothetical protein JKY99_06150, partial [Rhizobiales bacterium]|nr:hypothetical protein [Hyphomicrobiales bacterium]
MYGLMLRISKMMAYAGGMMLVALIFLTSLSILGRSLNGVLHSDFFKTHLMSLSQWGLEAGIGPINGDFELVEA